MCFDGVSQVRGEDGERVEGGIGDMGNKNIIDCPKEVSDFLNDPEFFGRMNDPTVSAYLKGPCGDSMEFYLVIEQKKIAHIKYYTDGCIATRSCAATVAHLAFGKTIDEALDISSGDVIIKLLIVSE